MLSSPQLRLEFSVDLTMACGLCWQTCAFAVGLAGLQAAIQQPERIRGVQLTNISLRMLHASKQSRLQRPAVAMVQRVLRETNLGQVRPPGSANAVQSTQEPSPAPASEMERDDEARLVSRPSSATSRRPRR